MVCQFFELRGTQLVSVRVGGKAVGGSCEAVCSKKWTDSVAADVCLADREWLEINQSINKSQCITRNETPQTSELRFFYDWGSVADIEKHTAQTNNRAFLLINVI